MNVFDEEVIPQDRHERPGRYRFRIYTHPRWTVVLISEHRDNDGPSVTNAAERLANIAHQLVKRYAEASGATLPEEVVLVEHYPAGASGPEEHFDRVQVNESGGEPSWSRLSPSEFEAMIGEPWRPESNV